MSSVSSSGLKSRTGDTRSGTVHLRSWRLALHQAATSQNWETNARKLWQHLLRWQCCPKCSWKSWFYLSIRFDVLWFVSSLNQEAQIGHFVVNRSKNGDLETGERTRLVLFNQTQEPFLVKAPIALGLYPAAHSILAQGELLTCLQFTRFSAIQSISIYSCKAWRTWAVRMSA